MIPSALIMPQQIQTVASPGSPLCQAVSGRAVDLVCDAMGRTVSWVWNVAATPSAFMIARGWSATESRWDAVADAGLPVMAVNDYPKWAKPRYWCTGDPPGLFRRRIWNDPEVMKFLPWCYYEDRLARTSAYGKKNQRTPLVAPNVHFYHRNTNDYAFDFLWTPWANWGTSEITREDRGHTIRSSVLAGLRLCWHLGYRNVFLLGCDCAPHHHPDPNYYDGLQDMLEQLQPEFVKHGYRVVCAHEDSHIRCFEIMTFAKAVEAALNAEPVELERLPRKSPTPPREPSALTTGDEPNDQTLAQQLKEMAV